MPAVESPFVSPGVPQVPFVMGHYELPLMEVIILGPRPFFCGRSRGPHFPLRASPLSEYLYAKSGFVLLEGSGS